MTEKVPKSDLEELVERWRESHEWATENREICSNEAIRKAESMIEDLEAVLEE